MDPGPMGSVPVAGLDGLGSMGRAAWAGPGNWALSDEQEFNKKNLNRKTT